MRNAITQNDITGWDAMLAREDVHFSTDDAALSRVALWLFSEPSPLDRFLYLAYGDRDT